MRRRLAIAILLTVWTTLIAGGLIAYSITRAVLLDYFDESLFAYAASVPGLVHAPGTSPTLSSLGADHFRVVDDISRTVPQPTTAPAGMEPRLIFAHSWYGADGEHLRTVDVRAYAIGKGSEPPRAVKVVYTRSAAAFDSRMNHLAEAFVAFGVVAGLLAAGVAWRVARSALHPLERTVQEIGSIDEKQLGRRLDTTALPSELEPMAVRLNEMLARLQAAFVARQRFLADASHELRTPVAALVMGMEVCLRHPRDAAGYRRALENSLGDARQLRALVERLMEQVRSENLSHDEPAQEIDVSAMLHECAQQVQPLVQEKGLTLHCEFPAGLKAVLPLGRWRSIVLNLLSNAIEYNRPAGRITLSCAGDTDGALTLRVSDTGPGIAPELVPHLFEPFFRADKSRQRQQGHLGLGLSLVKAHVDAMKGTCAVMSEVGQGTTFTVVLPSGLDTQALVISQDAQNKISHAYLMQAK